MHPTRRTLLPLFALLALLVLSGAISACGYSSDSKKTNEGEPLELGDLKYNVTFSRFLNPNDTEDSAYLQGAPKLPTQDYYLGVFMQIKNNGDTTQVVPSDMKVVDTDGHIYSPAPLHNDFSLDLGSQVQADGVVPDPESPAANGPVEGSMALFLISEASVDARPLELVIPGAGGETGEIQLDL
jgi:hypothetical protein